MRNRMEWNGTVSRFLGISRLCGSTSRLLATWRDDVAYPSPPALRTQPSRKNYWSDVHHVIIGPIQPIIDRCKGIDGGGKIADGGSDFFFSDPVHLLPSSPHRHLRHLPIWKRGVDLRADTSLAGFDGLDVHGAEQSFLFVGSGGGGDATPSHLPPGSLLVLDPARKEIHDIVVDATAAELVGGRRSSPPGPSAARRQGSGWSSR